VIFGLAFIGFELLAYRGIISINYAALEEWTNGVLGQGGQAEGVFNVIIWNLLYAASFIEGLAIGLKMG
jgi:uncharacterized membrane protein (Fun14 family)